MKCRHWNAIKQLRNRGRRKVTQMRCLIPHLIFFEPMFLYPCIYKRDCGIHEFGKLVTISLMHPEMYRREMQNCTTLQAVHPHNLTSTYTQCHPISQTGRNNNSNFQTGNLVLLCLCEVCTTLFTINIIADTHTNMYDFTRFLIYQIYHFSDYVLFGMDTFYTEYK